MQKQLQLQKTDKYEDEKYDIKNIKGEGGK